MNSISNFFESFSKKFRLGHIVILFCIYVAFSLIVGGSGIINKEMYLRMPLEISGKPLLQILFDVKIMNAGSWEARQLSYLFDVVDGNFVALCIRLGFPNFRSFTHYLFTLFLIIVLWKSMTEEMKLNRLLSLSFIALLLTTPSFIYSYYYRTSKIGVTLLSIILLYGLYRNYNSPEYSDGRQSKSIPLFLFFYFSALAIAFFDVLGVLIAIVLGFYSLLVFVIKPDKKKAIIFSGICLACITWAIFFLWLGPFLMLHITGQRADASFLATTPIQYIPAYLIQTAPVFFIDMVRYLLGYMTSVLALVVLIFFTTITIWLELYNWKHRANVKEINGKKGGKHICAVVLHSVFFNYLFLIGGISVVYSFLVIRHVEILWPDVRPVYYIMPAQAIILFGLAAWVASINKIKDFDKRRLLPILIIITVLLLARNINGSIKVKDLLYSGANAKMNIDTNSLVVLDALKNPRTRGYIPPTNIASDPIYQLFIK